MELLTREFIDSVINEDPKPLNEIGEFVYYRTYSRWLPDKGRRETWPETIKRVVNFSGCRRFCAWYDYD